MLSIYEIFLWLTWQDGKHIAQHELYRVSARFRKLVLLELCPLIAAIHHNIPERDLLFGKPIKRISIIRIFLLENINLIKLPDEYSK